MSSGSWRRRGSCTAAAPTDRSAPPMICRRMPSNRVMRRPIATPATARIATRRRSRRRGSA
ncbi:MAG: hypothetical protein EGR02_06290 [Clostridiales bacterium]|nr:hypothetical protein [Clostridiales bacterium]